MPGSWRRGLRSRPSSGAGISLSNGFEVRSRKSWNPTLTSAITPSTRARNTAGREVLNVATAKPQPARTVAHRSMEPSWAPHTAEIL